MSDSEMAAVAKRHTLRAFAVHIGAVEKGKSYPMKSANLIELILKVTDDDGVSRFPEICEMTDEQIREVMENEPSNKPARGKRAANSEPGAETPARRRRARKPVEPVEEEVNEHEEVNEPEEAAAEPDEPDEPEAPKRKPAARRKPGRRKVRAGANAEEPSAPPVSADGTLSELQAAVKLLTDMTVDSGVMVQDIRTVLLGDEKDKDSKGLAERVELIEQFLCWLYNNDFSTEGNEIQSLDEVSWT